MTSMPGGAADKEGNLFEFRWTAVRIAEVLRGDANSIQVEPLGSAGEGVEFILESNGVTWAEQVKSDSLQWTVHRLIASGVLDHARSHVDAGRCFRLVVAGGASQLETLADRSRQADSCEQFRSIVGVTRWQDVEKIGRAWSCEPDLTWRMLQSVWIDHHPRASLDRLVVASYRMLVVDGDIDNALAALRSIVDLNLHLKLTASMLWAQLESLGIRRRHLVGDETTSGRLLAPLAQAHRRTRSMLPSVGLIAADRVERLREQIESVVSHGRVLLVDGEAGSGKSTVVIEAAKQLSDAGWATTTIRMDAVDARTRTSRALGHHFELGDSPVVALSAFAGTNRSLLVIDQVDAVSSFSGRIPDLFEAIDETLAEAQAHAQMTVVMAVRTVDLTNDPRLSQLANRQGVERFTLSDFSADERDAALEALGVRPSDVHPGLASVLLRPLHLAIYARITDAERSGIDGVGRLYDELKKQMWRAVDERLPACAWRELLGNVVVHMSTNECLSAPTSIFGAYRDILPTALASVGCVVLDAGQVAFFHESFFDYLFAEQFAATATNLTEFLRAHGQQLFRRAQTRQVLTYLAGTDQPRFATEIESLLGDTAIRPHLQAVALATMRSTPASPAAWRVVETVAMGNGPLRDHALHLLASPQWFDAADETGRIEALLDGADDPQTDRLLNTLIVATAERGQRVADILRPRVDSSDLWTRRVYALVQWGLRPGVIPFAIELMEQGRLDGVRGPIAVNSDFWSLVDRPARAGDAAQVAEFIGAYLRRGLHNSVAAGNPDPFRPGFIDDHSQSASDALTAIADAAPHALTFELLGFVESVIEAHDRQTIDGVVARGAPWAFRSKSSHGIVRHSVFNALERALVNLVSTDESAAEEIVARIALDDRESLRFLACRALTTLGSDDDALAWLTATLHDNLELGWSSNHRWASRELIKARAASCSDSSYDAIEHRLLLHVPEWERSKRGYRSHGIAQFDLLTALPPERRSAPVRRRLQELERKFGPYKESSRIREVTVGFAQPPVPERATPHMRDSDWIAALRKYSTVESFWQNGQFYGGARSLSSSLAEQAKANPDRFLALASTFDDSIPVEAFTAIIQGAGESVESNSFSLVENVICAAVRRSPRDSHWIACKVLGDRAAAISDAGLRILMDYAAQRDETTAVETLDLDAPNDLEAKPSRSIEMRGLNSVRGQTAAAIGRVIFARDDLASTLTAAVEALTRDEDPAVRVMCGEAVLALSRTNRPASMDLASELFDRLPNSAFAARQLHRLLIFSLLWDPDRFAPRLASLLSESGEVGRAAGMAWSVLEANGAVHDSIPATFSELPPDARRGAAESAVESLPESIHIVEAALADDSGEVREAGARSSWHASDVDHVTLERLVGAALDSPSADSMFEGLLHSLAQSPSVLPARTLELLQRTVASAGQDLGDIRTAAARVAPDVTVVTLRLYRQSTAPLRSACLDIIDQLVSVRSYGIDEQLTQER